MAAIPPNAKIENFLDNSPRDFDYSLTDYNFITISSPTTGVDDIELSPCVLDSVNASNSASGRNSDASLCPSSTPKSIDCTSTSNSNSSHAKEDRNQGQTSKSKATVCGPVGSADPQPANSNPKTVCLVTYSQADVVKVPNHERFAEIVSNVFQSLKDNTPLVQKCVCGAEAHNQTRGFHYHPAIHLKNVRKRLPDTYNINVDFREFGQVYYHEYTYVIKIDPHFKTSSGHPCLDNPLRAGLSEAIYAKQRNAANKPKKSGPPKKQSRLDVEVLNDIVIKNKIRTDNELALFGKKQSMEGKRDIQRWLLTHTNRKQRQGFLNTACLLRMLR